METNGTYFNRTPITQRNIGLCILLSIVTCGIYGIVWFINLVDDLNTAAGETSATSGIMVFVLGLVTCGIYTLYWMYKAGELTNKAKAAYGLPTDNTTGILYLVLSLFGLGIVSYCLIQNDLNKMAM